MTERGNNLIRNYVKSLSLSALCFLRTWAILDSWLYWFYSESLPTTRHYLGYALCIFIFSFFFLIAFEISEKRQKWARFIGFSIIAFGCFIALNGIRELIPQISIFSLTKWLPIGVIFFLMLFSLGLFLYVIITFSKRAVKVMNGTLFILFPFAVYTLGVASYKVIQSNSLTVRPLASPQSREVERRVLWLIFDEADQRLIFESNHRLPHIEKFKNSSFFAKNAFSPSRNTERSIPALLTGKLVAEARPLSVNHFQIKFANEKNFLDFGSIPNIFQRLKQWSLNSGLVGWHIPYCRLLQANLTQCHNFGLYDSLKAPSLLGQVILLIKQLPLPHLKFVRIFLSQIFDIKWLAPAAFQSQVDRHKNILDSTKNLLSDNSLSLVFSHFSVPHPPYIFDENKKVIDAKGNHSYIGNLNLMDEAIGELISYLKSIHQYENFDILISSDHWLRDRNKASDFFLNGVEKDLRVPFLIHLAGQERGLEFVQSFNTILTGDLLIEIFKKNIKRPEDIATWISKNSKYSGPQFVSEPAN